MLARQLTEDAELRPLEPWQAQEFADHIAEAREHYAAWLRWGRTIVDANGARTFLQRFADKRARDDGHLYGIWLHNKLTGGVVFREFDTTNGNCELGVWINPEGQGRGLVTRACRHLIDWAVDERGMTRVEWRNMVTNTRSSAVAQRLGMTREGLLRQAIVHDGTRHDIEIWSLLSHEWRATERATPAQAASR